MVGLNTYYVGGGGGLLKRTHPFFLQKCFFKKTVHFLKKGLYTYVEKKRAHVYLIKYLNTVTGEKISGKI